MPFRPQSHKPHGYRSATEKKAEHDKRRGSAAERGYNHKWRKARLSYLKENPLCVHCLQQDRAVEASVVDHIRPHRGDQRLFWDTDNWQSLCKSCHDAKTVKEDGAFGNSPQNGRDFQK